MGSPRRSLGVRVTCFDADDGSGISARVSRVDTGSRVLGEVTIGPQIRQRSSGEDAYQATMDHPSARRAKSCATAPASRRQTPRNFRRMHHRQRALRSGAGWRSRTPAGGTSQVAARQSPLMERPDRRACPRRAPGRSCRAGRRAWRHPYADVQREHTHQTDVPARQPAARRTAWRVMRCGRCPVGLIDASLSWDSGTPNWVATSVLRSPRSTARTAGSPSTVSNRARWPPGVGRWTA
jgi:hypothetical protein